jgi:hypothetical protein
MVWPVCQCVVVRTVTPLRLLVKFNGAPGAELIPSAVLDSTGYREMIEAAVSFGDNALIEFGQVASALRDNAFV